MLNLYIFCYIFIIVNSRTFALVFRWYNQEVCKAVVKTFVSFKHSIKKGYSTHAVTPFFLSFTHCPFEKTLGLELCGLAFS